MPTAHHGTIPEPSASRSLTRLPTPRSRSITESRERRSGQRDELINASAYPRPVINASASPPSTQNGQQLQQFPSPQRPHSSRTIAASRHAAPQSPADPPVAQYAGPNANLPARCANLCSARMSPPASPYATFPDPRSPVAARGGPMSSGNLSGTLSGRGLFPAYDGMLSSHGMQSLDNPSKSVDTMPGIIPPMHTFITLYTLNHCPHH